MDKHIQEAFWHALEKSPIVMIGLDSSPGRTEPMTAQLDRDAHHAVWFFAGIGNPLAMGGEASAHFSSKDHLVFAALGGSIALEEDDNIREKLWSNAAEAWFPGGRHNPAVALLRFDIRHAEVWATEARLTGVFKMLTGTPIKAGEIGDHAIGNL